MFVAFRLIHPILRRRHVIKEIARYSFGVLAIWAAFELRVWLSRHLTEPPLYTTFYPAVMITALLCGAWPALVATVVAMAVVDYWVLAPTGHFKAEHPQDLISLLLFASMAGLITAVVAAYRKARSRAHQASLAAATLEAERRVEARFRMLIEATSDHCFRMSANWSTMHALTANHPTTALPAPGNAWMAQFIPEAEQPHVRAAIHEASREGSVLTLEHQLRLSDGSLGWALSRAVPLKDARGNVTEWLGATTDITARKTAALALERDSRRRLSTIFDKAPIAIALTEAASGRLVQVNETFAHLFEVAAPTLVGKKPTEISATMQSNAWADLEEKLCAQRALHNVELTLPSANGQERPFLINIDGVALDGQPHMLATFLDITRRKEAETLLRRSEEESRRRLEELTAIYDSTPVGLCVLDRQLRYLRVNKHLAQLNERSSEAHVGQSVDEVIPLLAPLVRHYVTEVLRTGEAAINKEWRMPVPGEPEQERIGLVTLVPLTDAGGNIASISTVVQEVTEQRRAEAALRDSEARNAEKRGRLQEALAAEQRRNDFLATLSHELRNPLAPIRTSIYILERTAPGSDQAQRALATIERQVKYMTRLVDDLLDVTRINRGKILLQRECLDFSDLVQRTADDHRASFVEAGIDLRIIPAPAPVWVNADATRLAQVLNNLLNNAVKFTPRGGHTIISVQASTASNTVLCSVRDNGRGIAAHALPHLFEPFSQVDATADRQLGGLGLGLALVKGLVEMHGGCVRVASQGIGHGSSFDIELPLQQEAPL